MARTANIHYSNISTDAVEFFILITKYKEIIDLLRNIDLGKLLFKKLQV